MKPMIAVLLLASALSMASSANIVRRDIKETENAKMELISMLNWENLSKIVIEYLYRDTEVQDLVRYFSSEEFKGVIKELDASPEYHQALDYLKNAGIHAVKVHNVLHVMLGLPTLPVEKDERDVHITGGFFGLMMDLAGVVNKEGLMNWHDHWKSSGLFKALMELPAQPFSQALKERFINLAPVKEFLAKLPH